jgi:hypothetical protein
VAGSGVVSGSSPCVSSSQVLDIYVVGTLVHSPVKLCLALCYGIQYAAVLTGVISVAISNVYALGLFPNDLQDSDTAPIRIVLSRCFAYTHSLMDLFYMGGLHRSLIVRNDSREVEVVIEVSDDSILWLPIVVDLKPCYTPMPCFYSSLSPTLGWPLFHIKRLNCCLQLLALHSDPRPVPKWLYAFLVGILEGNPVILSLLHPAINTHLSSDGKKSLKLPHVVKEGAKSNLMPSSDSFWKSIRVSLSKPNSNPNSNPNPNPNSTPNLCDKGLSTVNTLVPSSTLEELYNYQCLEEQKEMKNREKRSGGIAKSRVCGEKERNPGIREERDASIGEELGLGGDSSCPPRPDTAAELIERHLKKNFATNNQS